jgi:hypothetical protein
MDGQAGVSNAPWSLNSTGMDSDRVMQRAGQENDKPVDPFKLKAAKQREAAYEGPLHVYGASVKSKRRGGVYWMRCTAPDLASLVVCSTKNRRSRKSTHA